MTDTEHRVSKLEDKYHSIDTRQESFETYTKQRQDSFEDFVRNYIDINEKRLERMDAKFDKMEAKIDALSSQMHNLIITGAIGIAAIVVAIALK